MAMPDAPFLDFAADVKKHIGVPVIAVGRLGDPATAEAAVASGKTDFVALGRTLIADPQWADKVSRGEPIRRCLACNTCINDMRGGARIGCVVNGAAGRETMFAAAQPPRGERIAVIGAGPVGPHLCGARRRRQQRDACSRRANAPAARSVTPARRRCFKKSRPTSKALTAISRIWSLPARKRASRSASRADVSANSELLAPFDHIVIATGAEYRFGLGAARRLRRSTPAPRAAPGIARLFSLPKLRDWFYYRARRATGGRFKNLARPGQRVTVIGDAVRAGKSKQAIAGAFEAALLPAAN